MSTKNKAATSFAFKLPDFDIASLIQGNAANFTPMASLQSFLQFNKDNAKAISEIMRCSISAMQEATNRQTQVFLRITQDNARLSTSVMSDLEPDNRLQIQSDVLQNTYKVSSEGADHIREIFRDMESEVSKIISDSWLTSCERLQATLCETAANDQDQVSKKLKGDPKFS